MVLPIVPCAALAGARGRPFGGRRTGGVTLRIRLAGTSGLAGESVDTAPPRSVDRARRRRAMGGRSAGGPAGARVLPIPDIVTPMQPAPGRLPDDGDWVVEFAWEGLRWVAHVRPDGLPLRTATGRDIPASFPELAEPLTRRAPREGMVLDGTVVAMGEGGLPRRSRLQRRTATARPSPALVRRTPAGLIVGDLLWLGGHAAAALPYRRRRELLRALGPRPPPGGAAAPARGARARPAAGGRRALVPDRGGRGGDADRRGVRRRGDARPSPRR